MKITLAMGTALLLTALSAQAQETALPLWEVGLAAGLAATPSYPASAERASRALMLPYLVYRGKVLRADRDGVGARLLYSRDVEFDIGLAASLPSRATDSIARQGMDDLGTLIEVGPRLKWTLARPAQHSQLKIELPLRAVFEFNSGVKRQGLVFEPELKYETHDASDDWRLNASASLVLGDQSLNNFFYAVRPEFATAARAAYDARAGLIAKRLSLSTSKKLNPDLRLFGFVRFESYAGAANEGSPLYLKSSATSVGMALTWTLGRSERLAQD
ncbi:MAG: MipA/OmpV family protein [Rhodoferax sp.]